MKKQSLFLLRASFLIFTLICSAQGIFAQLTCGTGELSYDQTITYNGANIEQNHTFDFAVCSGWDISDARITVVAQGDIDGDSGQDESWIIGTENAPNAFTVGNGGDPIYQCDNTLSQGPFSLTAIALLTWKADGMISFTAMATDNVSFDDCLGNDLISVRLEMCYSECMGAPVASCQDATVNLDVNGMGSILATDINNGSTASCSDLSISLTGQQSFTCTDIGQIFSVTLSATDECGGSDDCTANISVEDNQAPVLDCSGIATTLTAGSNCTATTIGAATIVDNCSPVNVDFTFTGPDGSILAAQAVFPLATGIFDASNLSLPLGETVLDVIVTDAGENTDDCSVTITVENSVAPTITCTSAGVIDVNTDCIVPSGSALAYTAIITDNCSPTVLLTETITDFLGNEVNTYNSFVTASPTGNTLMIDVRNDLSDGTYIYNVVIDDGVGGTDDCTFNLSIADNTPEANCKDFTVQLDVNGMAVVSADDVNDGSIDNCTDEMDLILELDITEFDCDDIGSNPYNFTVTDEGGSSSVCSSSVIIVEDNVEPDANCQNVTVNLDENGNGSTTAAAVDNNSSDACGIASLSLDITDFDCSNIGDNEIVLTVTDVNTNVSTCNAIATVQDLIPAVIECRQPVSTVTSPGLCIAQNLTILEPFSIYDNCGAENVTFTRIPAGNDFPVGETELNWTATDANGNTSTCISKVLIADGEFPSVSSCNAVIDFVDLGSCFAQVIVHADVFDNCGVASVEGLGTFTLPFGSYPNPITVTDVNGNVTVHEFTIYIHDDFNPEFQNCPEETVVLQAGTNGTASYPALTPVATDNCGVPTITNNLPEDGLPLGSSVVTFTAEDTYGNTTDCVVNVEVTGGIALHPVGNIASSLEENETTQTIAWNALNAATICELCEETELEGFRYVGTWWGHQYFLANESSLTRDEANLIAEGYDAHLAVINDAAENNYLTEALDSEIRSAWIGLMPQLVDEQWTFAWDNGDALDFNAINFEEITAETRIILGEDGTWKSATTEEDKYFLIERPCVNFVQTGPIYIPEIENNEEEIPAVLLRSGDVWSQGEYEVTYALTDMCGNETVMNFDVNVLPEIAEYCTTSGTSNTVWVEKLVFHDLTNESENSEGYTDFSEEATTMNIGDGVILVQMKAGGNEAEDLLYWNIYLDANADGDFFDTGEMLYQVASREDVETNLTLPVVSLENARLRVMVSRYAFAAPCGDTYVGEIEDYTLNLLVPEDYARAACDVQVAGLNGERSGFNVDLDWTVNSACPINNYTVEYSLDGVNFEPVTQINETDFSDLVYTKDYIATLPSVIGTVTYRIKVQAANQAAFYTNSVSFRMNGKPNAPILHPNPADTYVKVALGKSVGQSGIVTIYDNLGKVRMVQSFDGSSDELTLNLEQFIDGIYHVTIQLDGKRIQTQRLVIDKLYGWSPAR